MSFFTAGFMNYLLIRNGLVVSGNKVFKSDILVGNSKILAISKYLRRPEPGTPVIDAGGRFVFPGAVDTRHHELLVDDMDDTESINRLLISEVTNGTTSLFDTFSPDNKQLIQSDMNEKAHQMSAHHMIDFAFHFSPDKCLGFDERDFITSYVKSGITSITLSLRGSEDESGDKFIPAFSAARQLGLTVIIELNTAEPAGSTYMYNKGPNLNDVSKHMECFKRVLELLKDETFPVLISRIRFSEEVSLLKQYQKYNRRIVGEVEMPCFLGEKGDFSLHNRSMLGGLELSDVLNPIHPRDFVHLIESDLFIPARPYFNLMIGNTRNSAVFNRPDKYFGLKYYSSMLYTLCVVYGKLAITDFVSCFSTRPAHLMGLYPQKGIIRPGSDADIVIWNPDFERNLYCNILSEGKTHELKLQGKADFVFANGKMIYDGETFFRDNVHGGYLYRNPA
jgi:dihydroorotase-like cyclic amidohydrolase